MNVGRTLPLVLSGWSLELDRGSVPASLFLARLLLPLGVAVRDEAGRAMSSADVHAALGRWDCDDAIDGSVRLNRRSGGASYTVSFTGPGGSPSSDAGTWAYGGLASVTGEPDGPPLAPAAPLASFCAALYSAIAILAARFSGASRLEISIDLGDAVSSIIEIGGLKYAAEGVVRGRGGDSWGLAGWGVYRCRTGAVAIALRDREQLIALGEVLGIDHLRSDDYADFTWGICERVEEVHALLIGALSDADADEVETLLIQRRIAAAKVPGTLADLLHDPHLNQRGAFERVGVCSVPASPFLVSGARTAVSVGDSGPATPSSRPLANVRVLDLSSVWAGPLAARILADLGADVVKVARPGAQVGQYSSGKEWDRDFYAILNDRNKTTYEADLRSEADREWFRDQVRTADVLIENFAPGSLERNGLGHQVLHDLNPSLVVIAMPALGLSGPKSAAVGYGTTIEQAAGIGWLYADEGQQPHRSGINFSDPIAGLYAAIGALVGLLSDRARCVVELSQQEASLTLMSGVLWAYQVDGRVPEAIKARGSEAGWAMGSTGRRFDVRDVAAVVGQPMRPGSPSVRWATHPDGRDYPLAGLPWVGAFESAVVVTPAEMPRALSEPSPGRHRRDLASGDLSVPQTNLLRVRTSVNRGGE